MRFRPKAGDFFSLVVRGVEISFRVVPHPDPTFGKLRFPHAMEGERWTVWHLEASELNQEYALQVRNARYPRPPDLEQICAFLNTLKCIDGLASCERYCLAPETSGPNIQQYPELAYSILMPWIKGISWFDAHQDHETTRGLSRWQCLQLALRLASVLSDLERRGIAHCALSPYNLIIDLASGTPRVELVGEEDFFTPELPENGRPRNRLPEYRHPSETQWDAKSDRFPAAILLSEILGWYDDKVRALCDADSYFEAKELQDDDSQRLQLLAGALSAHHADLTFLLREAWKSRTPDECPTLNQWREALERVSLTKIEYTWLAVGELYIRTPEAIPRLPIGARGFAQPEPRGEPSHGQGSTDCWKARGGG